MAGAFKKTMIYLGLADGDDYQDESFSNDRAPARSEAGAQRAASVQHTGAVSAPTGAVQAPARPTAVASAPAQAPQADAGQVVSLADRAGASNSSSSSAAGQYNSTNLAVDPEYRAPVTPIKRAPSTRDESEPMRKITTVHPRSYNDAKVIGESFREDIPVIMNVSEMGEAEAKRLVDFAAGLVFGLGGSIERVTNKVFLLTPKNVEVLAEERSAAEPEAAPAGFFNQS
ncbi:cell division protein SepF [Nesterenkonia flava]|uniref:Cell division protein SepF n=1 Tax=Nesterenkonia flava TaxID=469799 RepID=A0ABU1FW39_9MICC|nr:cell division protein SepF [Nesterenkonia flava]MDR5712547.1 cell division protein SepF [Nesterenkonia flava]